MSGLGDTYLSGLGDDGILARAAGYDGFLFDALPGFGKSAILDQSDPASFVGTGDFDVLSSFFAHHVALPGSADTIDFVDLARGLFATHQSSLNAPVFQGLTAAAQHEPDVDAGVAPLTQPFDVSASIDFPSLGITPDGLAALQEQVHLAVQSVFEHNALGFIPIGVEHNVAGFAPVDVI